MEKLKEIAEWFQNFGITLYQVGGSLRDKLIDNPVEDIDICVVGGSTMNNVGLKLDMLYSTGNIDYYTEIFGSFPIWKVIIDEEEYEFAMARKERKVGQSRQEFECEVNNVTIKEDLMRRDLTINAIAKNIVTGEIVDPFNGRHDIEHKLAHPVSEAFAEDTLRVYRAARFIAKFELTPTLGLIALCQDLKPVDISNERVGMELMKMLKTAKKPSLFFNLLKEIGWLEYHFPELHALIGVPQSPIHHPEGCVYIHTMHCIDAAEGWFYRAVMLCHDLGKATTTLVDGAPIQYCHEGVREVINRHDKKYRITAHGHEEAGVQLTKDILKRIHFSSHDGINQIACLVELHMIRTKINSKNWERIVRQTLRKLHKHNISYYQLCHVIFFDLCGRPPLEANFINIMEELHFYEYADLLDSMSPIVTGKKLIELGMEPGIEMGKIVSHALELQDRGTLKEDNWQKVLKGCGYKFFQTKK